MNKGFEEQDAGQFVSQEKALGSGFGDFSPCARATRSVSERYELTGLMARVKGLGTPCALNYSREGDYEYATLEYQRPGGVQQTIRNGWRSGETDNESIAHVWIWMALKQLEGEGLALRKTGQS